MSETAHMFVFQFVAAKIAIPPVPLGNCKLQIYNLKIANVGKFAIPQQNAHMNIYK